ncbi:hypothetical protein LJR234_006076 [Mesorhizobium amorphae]|uniref:hypothetical protein n=1 Tax=Mesorhizobium amorphae TaxID=71433 RepID=UPI003ED12A9E
MPDLVGSDVISAGTATDKLFADAEKQGIEGAEIVEETGTGSVYETIVDAVGHYHGPRLAGEEPGLASYETLPGRTGGNLCEQETFSL